MAPYLLPPLFKKTNPKHTSQNRPVIDPQSKRVYDLLLSKTIPVTLNNQLLKFRHTDKKFELQGDLLKIVTKKN